MNSEINDYGMGSEIDDWMIYYDAYVNQTSKS